MFVIKRDGTQVPFNKQKIINAINKAFAEVKGSDYDTTQAEIIASQIEKNIEHFYNRNLNITNQTFDEVLAELERGYNVEQIQNDIEDLLMQSEHRDVARAYIRFRQVREVAREQKDTYYKAISEKLEAKNIQKQNANVDEQSFGGRIGEASDVMTKQYALDYCISKMAKANHLNNEIYIHDLSHYAVGDHNCLSVPFDHLLANGFNTRQTDVRPAGSVNTAFQLVAVIFQLQSLQQFGGVSATHLDWTMVPYVRKSFYKHYKDGMKYVGYGGHTSQNFSLDNCIEDSEEWNSISDIPIYNNAYGYNDNEFKEVWQYAYDMTEREIHQAVEGLYHNLNTLQSRSGNQLPFTSINYGTCTLPEGRMIIQALLEVSIEGLGKNKRTSIFPCSIFQVMKGVNKEPGTPNYDLYRLALESTAQRLYPNYANVDWSGNAGYDRNDPTTYFSTMGKCKLQLM